MASAFIKALDLGEVDPDLASCCIASSVSDYVTKAMRLAKDQDYHSRVASAIRLRSHRIFDEKSVIFEWARFLARALELRISNDQISDMIGFVPDERHRDDRVAEAVEVEQRRWLKSAMMGNVPGSY